MTKIDNLSDADFHHELLKVVKLEFGLDGLSRFMTGYCTGKGDYTRDRHLWLDDLTLEDITKDLEALAHTRAA